MLILKIIFNKNIYLKIFVNKMTNIYYLRILKLKKFIGSSNPKFKCLRFS